MNYLTIYAGSTQKKAVVARALRKQIVNKYLKPQFTSDAVAKCWDPLKSARQNLSAMGLAHNPNKSVVHGNPSFSASFAEGVVGDAKRDPTELFVIPIQSDDLRANDINMRRRALPQLECDQIYAATLIERHGVDFIVSILLFRNCV